MLLETNNNASLYCFDLGCGNLSPRIVQLEYLKTIFCAGVGGEGDGRPTCTPWRTRRTCPTRKVSWSFSDQFKQVDCKHGSGGDKQMLGTQQHPYCSRLEGHEECLRLEFQVSEYLEAPETWQSNSGWQKSSVSNRFEELLGKRKAEDLMFLDSQRTDRIAKVAISWCSLWYRNCEQ